MNFSPFPHSLSISSLSLHFLSVSSSFPHSLFISSQPGCKAATIRAALGSGLPESEIYDGLAIYQTLPFCSFFQKVPFDMDFI